MDWAAVGFVVVVGGISYLNGMGWLFRYCLQPVGAIGLLWVILGTPAGALGAPPGDPWPIIVASIAALLIDEKWHAPRGV